ncbi:vacuolar amino acid transporter 4 [Pseudohyphozyma bogoriensis]|nr:vacuolar amino acid transporter 4 [Pseudohyphozyma bogoriensis]
MAPSPSSSLPIPASSSPRRSPSLLASQLSSSPVPTPPSVPQIPLPSNAPTPQFGSPRSQQFLAPPAPGAASSTRPSSATSSHDDHASSPAPSNPDELTDAQKAEIVRRHLMSADDQRAAAAESSWSGLGASPRNAAHWAMASGVNAGGVPGSSKASSTVGGDEDYPTPYGTQGGDIVAPIYKWAAQQPSSNAGTPAGGSGPPSLRRSKSLESVRSRRASHGAGPGGPSALTSTVSGPAGSVDAEGGDPNESGMSVREILEPGGFRRDFVKRRLASQGHPPPAPGTFTKSFIVFLSLYGHLAGEDLEEIDEDDEEEYDEEDELDYDGSGSTIRGHIAVYDDGLSDDAATTPKAPNRILRTSTEHGEDRPLLRSSSEAARPRAGRGMSRKRVAASAEDDHGDATVTQAVMMLLKSFVGTGVLFLGKAFYNGGIVFSAVVLCFIAMISLYSFLLLVETRLVVHGSFGDIGGILFGKYMRWCILFSIVLSQIGFVAAYTIFVSQNLQAFFMAVSNCRTFIPIGGLIAAQLVLFLHAFILFGLVYIFSNEIKVLAANGLADVAMFNSKDFPLLIGTAVFSFEGIGLVIPITESMKDPHQFPKVLTGVMIGVMILFAGAGVLAYAAYGSAIQTVVFVNLPQEDRFVNAAQFLYSIAILLSTPLQLFPAVRIMENGIFSRSGKHSNTVKWEKNAFRCVVVVGSSVIAWAGASDLDKFVSLIGSVACVPLCFCYPAMLHYKACATTRKQKIADAALFVFGLGAALYTTANTIILLAAGGESAPPTFGKCPPHQ